MYLKECFSLSNTTATWKGFIQFEESALLGKERFDTTNKNYKLKLEYYLKKLKSDNTGTA